MTEPSGGGIGQVALVSGAAGGIGTAICRMLGRAGSAIAMLDIDEQACRDRAAELNGSGIHARAYPCDIADPVAVRDVVDKIGVDLGAPTVVVHNAGWTGPNVPFLETSLDDQDKIIQINFGGALNLVRATLRPMLDGNGGAFVFVGSDAGRVGTPKETIYSGAKAALVGFAKALATEVARHGVTVNVVSPGSTDTPLIRRLLSPEQIDRRIRANPMRRLGTPEDIAAAVAYLAGPTARYITGQVLSVNGGMSRVD